MQKFHQRKGYVTDGKLSKPSENDIESMHLTTKSLKPLETTLGQKLTKDTCPQFATW